MSNYITIKLRRGTQAQWTATNPVLAEGEFGAETDTRKFKIGNGVTAWNSLQYWGGSGGGAADFTDLGDVPASYTGQGGKYVKVKSTADGLEFGTLTIAAGDLPSGIDAANIANGTVSNTEFQYLNGVTAPIQNALDFLSANKVPYSGASGDVNLGEYGAQLGNLEFDNTPTNTPTTDGSVFWDSGDGTLQLQMKGGAIQQVGMNQFARVYNDTASAFTKGQVVYISGSQGNRIAAKLAQANSEATSKGTIGFVVETIAAGAEGNIITSGPLYKLNTLGLTAGANLYLSATTAGGYTETPPQAPDNGVVLGYVERVHGTVGSIYVKVDNGYELEELHDVDLTESKTTPVDADAVLLQDSADGSIWKRLTWANLKATAKAYFDSLYVTGNTAITGATKTKITYDAKGLVTAGADATTADIADSSNKRYVTDAQLTVIGNTSGTNTGDQTITLTGDVTGSGTGSFAATIASNAVTNAKLAQVATATFKGRTTAGTGNVEDLTATQATALLNNFTSTLKGLAPASGGGTTNFLRADGTWAAPAGGGAGDATTLYENFTQVGVANSTTKTAIVSYTLPTDLVAGDMIEVHMSGTYKNNSGASRNFNITHELGATTMLTQAVSLVVNADERTWNGVARLYIVSTTAQRYGYFGLGSIGAVGTMATASTASIPMNGTGYGTAAETITSAKTYQVAVAFATASADLFLYCQAVKIVKIAAA